MGSPSRRRPKALTIALFTSLTIISIAGAVATRSVNANQQARLLEDRSREVGVVLTSAMASVASPLAVVGESYAAQGTADGSFTAGAGSLVRGNVTGVGVASFDGAAAVVGASVGSLPPTGSPLEGERLALGRRAVETDGLVTALLGDAEASTRILVFALGRPDGLVVLAELTVTPGVPPPSGPGSPYRELNAALYRSTTPDRDQLLLSTTADPGTLADGFHQTLTIGGEQWLLVSTAKGPLIGSLAQIVPWAILGIGLLAAAGVAGVVWLLQQRRQYAEGVVEERTAELRSAMAGLDEARQAADAANEAKSAFLSRMSHELRTPLNAVIGFAQVLQMGELTDEQRDETNQILKAGNHLLGLINEVLDISRIESGDLALSPEAVLVGEIVAESVELMRPLADQRSIRLVGDHHATCRRYVLADRQRIKQVLLNLLSNAVKYNERGGSVSLTCAAVSPTRLRLDVVDDGPGVHPDDVGRLFVPFERLGAGQSDIEGTGIGLALSRRLTEAMGGTLTVESTFGEGSTFSIELPLVEGPIERLERLNGELPVAAATSPRPAPSRVLYIEDNLANIKLMERVLARREDIELVPAMQGRIGLDLARQVPPGLILLDLHLPDRPGDEILQELRENPTTERVPVIMVSADATPGQVQRLLSSGASGYITKPFDVEHLLDTVQRHLPLAPR